MSEKTEICPCCLSHLKDDKQRMLANLFVEYNKIGINLGVLLAKQSQENDDYKRSIIEKDYELLSRKWDVITEQIVHLRGKYWKEYGEDS
jgi:hypothetical protein